MDRSEDGEYKALKYNVDMLKLIQLGVTLVDETGKLAEVNGIPCLWQFNFKEFSMENDLYASDSINLLKEAGIDFSENQSSGVSIAAFSELLMTSGLVLNEMVHWIGFCIQYDIAYLLKALTCSPLPESEIEFFELVRLFFPNLYDIKYLQMVIFISELHCGLNQLANSLQITRIGQRHQAGSDSLLAANIFFELVKKYYSKLEYFKKYSGKIAGLGDDARNSFAFYSY